MKPIQPILIILLFLILIRFFGKLKTVFFEKFLLIFAFILGVIFILIPSSSVYLARLVGVTRGADLVIYTALVVMFFFCVLFYSKIQDLEIKITEISRFIALLDKEKPAVTQYDRGTDKGEFKTE